MESRKKNEVHTVDMSCAHRKGWLVKVPKYLAKSLESAQPMQVIGKVKIDTKSRNSQQICFNLSKKVATSYLLADKENIKEVPIEHNFNISVMESQTMAIFSENEIINKVSIEGIVEQKGEFSPVVSTNYIDLQKDRIKRSAQPLRTVQQVDRSVTVFKPTSRASKTKKRERYIKIKKDRETVRNMLFELFEKHQYYYMRDLERLTLQPVYFLKEVLKEMCVYNTKNPHQYMWELRPEFRHYSKSCDTKDTKE